MTNEDRLLALGQSMMAVAETMDLYLHAVVLVSTGGSLLLEGVTSEAHRAAVVAEIHRVAEHLAEVQVE